MSISQFLKGSAGIAAIAGSGGLAAGLGLAGSLFGQSGGARLRNSRDSAQQAARERFDPSIYQPMHTQGQTMATEGLGRMEDIARERTVASLFRQRPQPMGSSAREIALQQQQSGMARQALAGFEGQLTQADIARRQEGEMMATQAETQMRDTRAQRGSALNNIESMYQAERGARRDKTIGAIFGTVAQLGSAYLMGRGNDGGDDGEDETPELPDNNDNGGVGNLLSKATDLIGGQADFLNMMEGIGNISQATDQGGNLLEQVVGSGRVEGQGDFLNMLEGIGQIPEGQQQSDSQQPYFTQEGFESSDEITTPYVKDLPPHLKTGHIIGQRYLEQRSRNETIQGYNPDLDFSLGNQREETLENDFLGMLGRVTPEDRASLLKSLGISEQELEQQQSPTGVDLLSYGQSEPFGVENPFPSVQQLAQGLQTENENVAPTRGDLPVDPENYADHISQSYSQANEPLNDISTMFGDTDYSDRLDSPDPVQAQVPEGLFQGVQDFLKDIPEQQPNDFDLEGFAERVAGFEGFSEDAYPDPRVGDQKPTIGYGTTMYPDGTPVQMGDTITQDQAKEIKLQDLQGRLDVAQDIVPNFESLPTEAKEIVIDMMYNMGNDGFRGFRKMITALTNNDFTTAAQEAKNSDWYKQVGDRSREHVETLLRLGQ